MNVSVSKMQSCSHENTKGIAIKRQGLMMAEVPKINYAVWIFHRNWAECVFLFSLCLSLALFCQSRCTQHMCKCEISTIIVYEVGWRIWFTMVAVAFFTRSTEPSTLLSLSWNNKEKRNQPFFGSIPICGQKEIGTIARNRGKFGYIRFRFLFHTFHQTVKK